MVNALTRIHREEMVKLKKLYSTKFVRFIYPNEYEKEKRRMENSGQGYFFRKAYRQKKHVGYNLFVYDK